MNLRFFIFLICCTFLVQCAKSDMETIGVFPCEECSEDYSFENIDAKIIEIKDDSLKIIYAIDIQKKDLRTNKWTVSDDSIFIPCPELPTWLLKNNLHVKISGRKLNCGNKIFLPSRDEKFGYLANIYNIKTTDTIKVSK